MYMKKMFIKRDIPAESTYKIRMDNVSISDSEVI